MKDKLDMLLSLLRNAGHTVIWHPENEDDSGIAAHWQHAFPDTRKDSDDERRMTFHVTAYATEGGERTISSAIAMVKGVRVVETVSVEPVGDEEGEGNRHALADRLFRAHLDHSLTDTPEPKLDEHPELLCEICDQPPTGARCICEHCARAACAMCLDPEDSTICDECAAELNALDDVVAEAPVPADGEGGESHVRSR